EVLEYLAKQWSHWRPGFPFTYYSLSNNFERQYESEKRISQGINFFAILAVFVSSLGVFGLALFMAEQRAKEISIRKALGADIAHIMLLLSKWFIGLIGLALVLAVPLSYVLLGRWLSTFAFAIEMNFIPFLIALIVVLLGTTVSVVAQLFRAALESPVKALRCE
ncbi:MAG TPA: FtsX-like permease family protein, partial [Cyclobacteriaceae bacterium]|nr:FtsX-like permease family protein [Cyclobacteriaceae bacterium]